MQSGARNLVVLNIQFEPDLTLRNLRERLRLTTPHWPLFPEALGVITGDFNISDPECEDAARNHVTLPHLCDPC